MSYTYHVCSRMSTKMHICAYASPNSLNSRMPYSTYWEILTTVLVDSLLLLTFAGIIIFLPFGSKLGFSGYNSVKSEPIWMKSGEL